MDTINHTPGPWRHGANGPRVEWEDASGFLVTVADCGVSYVLPDAQMLANAALVAAAPDMLEALRIIAACQPDKFGGVTLGSWERARVQGILERLAQPVAPKSAGIVAELEALGAYVWPSGGGCEALRKEGASGAYAMFTADDDPSLPVDGERVLYGEYGPHDAEPIFIRAYEPAHYPQMLERFRVWRDMVRA